MEMDRLKRLNTELRAALEAAMTEMEAIAKNTGTDIETFLCWEQCQAAIAAEVPKAEVQVVVAVEGGVIQDTFAYTNGALADAKQAELDKMYGIERDADGYVTNESDNQVITYALPLDKE